LANVEAAFGKNMVPLTQEFATACPRAEAGAGSSCGTIGLREALLAAFCRRTTNPIPPWPSRVGSFGIFRKGSSYAKVAADLPKLESAGAVEAKQINSGAAVSTGSAPS
jgi:hypothetical protein